MRVATKAFTLWRIYEIDAEGRTFGPIISEHLNAISAKKRAKEINQAQIDAEDLAYANRQSNVFGGDGTRRFPANR